MTLNHVLIMFNGCVKPFFQSVIEFEEIRTLSLVMIITCTYICGNRTIFIFDYSNVLIIFFRLIDHGEKVGSFPSHSIWFFLLKYQTVPKRETNNGLSRSNTKTLLPFKFFTFLQFPVLDFFCFVECLMIYSTNNFMCVLGCLITLFRKS